MPRLDFVPERDGFHLGNSSGNQILPGTPLTFTTQTRSRCHEAHNPNRHLRARATSLRLALAGRPVLRRNTSAGKRHPEANREHAAPFPGRRASRRGGSLRTAKTFHGRATADAITRKESSSLRKEQ